MNNLHPGHSAHKLKDLRTHNLHLALALTSPDLSKGSDWDRADPEWMLIGEWLSAAAGIVSMTYGKLDHGSMLDSMGLCEPATEHYNRRDKLQSEFLTALSRFSLIWGAFEAVAEMVAPRGGNRSVVLPAREYLKREFNLGSPLVGFECVLLSLKEHVKLSDFRKDLIGLFNFAPGNDSIDGGIRVVYELRNKLAHGVLALPEDAEGHPIPVCIINLSSKLVLLTIQMLMWSYLKNRSQFIVAAEHITKRKRADLRPLLEFIHLVKKPTKSAPLEFRGRA